MSETGWRLTAWSIMSVIWFVILNHATNWSTALVFLAAVILAALLSFIDLIFVAIVSAID